MSRLSFLFFISLCPLISMDSSGYMVWHRNKVFIIIFTIITCWYNFPITHSPITDTSMYLCVLVTLFDPLFCFMVHLYVPLSSGWTGSICRLPLGIWVNLLPSSTKFSPCLLQVICGRGVPSAPQFIVPDVLAVRLCWSLVFSVNLAVEINKENNHLLKPQWRKLN